MKAMGSYYRAEKFCPRTSAVLLRGILNENKALISCHRRLVLLVSSPADRARGPGCGMEVYVMTRVNQHADAIREEGFRLIPWKGIVPGGVNPFRELRALAEVVKQYRSIRPDLVHHVHNKPILYGGLAARWCRIPALNTVAGLGHVFADKSLRMRALQRVLLVLFRFALKGSDRSLVAFQNSDDFEYFLDKQIILPNKSLLIRGSGVDLDKFSATPILQVLQL